MRRAVISRLSSCVRPLPPMIAIKWRLEFAKTHPTFGPSPLGEGSGGGGSFVLESVNRRQVAPQAVGVHAEAEDVAVGNGDADEVGLHRLGAPDVLVGEYRREHPRGPHLGDLLLDRGERDAL